MPWWSIDSTTIGTTTECWTRGILKKIKYKNPPEKTGGERCLIMKQIFDLFKQPLVAPNSIVPPIGKYISIIRNFNTIITFINEIQESILVVEYLLLNTSNCETFTFSETYSLSNNPRTEKLYAYLYEHVDAEKVFLETELNGMVEEVTLDYDYLGGYVHPIISERKFIYLPDPEPIPLIPMDD